jgi:nucleoid DNA-binding protein
MAFGYGVDRVRKEKFVAAVAAQTSLTAAQVAKVLVGVEEVCAQELKDCGEVRVPGLVQIKRLRRDERLVRNPRSREEFVMGASVLVKAKPVTSFSARIKAENPVT